VLAAADVVLCCAPSEGFGLTAVEALAAGRPLVSTPVGVVPELIERFGDICELVPPRHTAADLAAAAKRAAARSRSPSVAQQIADAFSVKRMTNRWRKLLSAAW